MQLPTDYREIFRKVNCGKWAKWSIFLLVFGVLFGNLLFPKLLKFIMQMVSCACVNSDRGSAKLCGILN